MFNGNGYEEVEEPHAYIKWKRKNLMHILNTDYANTAFASTEDFIMQGRGKDLARGNV